MFLGNAVYFYNLEPRRPSADNADARAGNAAEFSEETHALLVRFTIHGRRSEIELIGIPESTCDGRAPGARMHFHRDACHRICALRLATPAATRRSITSKAMASSSQSWL